jgi:hypothetical protein
MPLALDGEAMATQIFVNLPVKDLGDFIHMEPSSANQD